MTTITRISRQESDTLHMAAALAQVARPGLVVCLDGDLGTGKTVFARGFIKALIGDDQRITSPTFTLMNPYEGGRIPVYHFDLYRLGEPDELGVIGADEIFEGEGISLVEWPQRGTGWIPESHIHVHLKHMDGDDPLRNPQPELRELVISAYCAVDQVDSENYAAEGGAVSFASSENIKPNCGDIVQRWLALIDA